MSLIDFVLGAHGAGCGFGRDTVARLTAERDAAIRERDGLRRQLQNIRVAHEALQLAIHPPKIQGK